MTPPRPPPTSEARIPDGTGRTPEVVPHPGLRNRIFVDQHENRDPISRALGMQIPNPGSVSRRAGRDIFDFSPWGSHFLGALTTGLCFRARKPTFLHCHKKGLESSCRGVNPTKTHSKASPTHLEGSRGPNSDPKISDLCPPTAYNSTSQSTPQAIEGQILNSTARFLIARGCGVVNGGRGGGAKNRKFSGPSSGPGTPPDV